MGLRLRNSSGNYVELNAPSSIGTDVNLVLPNTDGSSGQYLQTDGSGALSWAASTEYQGPTFAATTNANQSVTPSTWTKVQFNTELFDTDSCYDSSTNYRFTPTKAGYYQVSGAAYADYATTATTAFMGGIYKNGTLAVKYFATAPSAHYGTALASQVLYLNGSTDYVEFYIWITGTGTLVTHDTGNNYFSATWVHS